MDGFNKRLSISVAGSRKSALWPATEMFWFDFIERLKRPERSTESYQEYINLPKQSQDELKDRGGFVGGTFKDNRRKASNVLGRDLITLDLDNIPTGKTDEVRKRVAGLGCMAALYSTRKHCSNAPRLRIVVPTNRTLTADEYEPVSRKLAEIIGIQMCDPTTFEASRLMYWPSVCRDGEYICDNYPGNLIDADGMLGLYANWRDISEWPRVPGTDAVERRNVAKQEDPLTKRGLIGAFCRTYSITEAMAKFIPGMYEPTVDPTRFTFTGGSTVGGAVVYDDKYLYSHHATDPCSGKLVNAFDLIRLHKYSELDYEALPDTPHNKLPSFMKMEELAGQDVDVCRLVAKERQEQAQQAFASSGHTVAQDSDDNWRSKLDCTQSGIRKTVNNLLIILRNDPLLKGKIATDVFAGRGVALGALPWEPGTDTRMWTEADDSGIFWYIETQYDCAQRDKITDALNIVGNEHKINEVTEYLNTLTWDGVPRIDTLLSDYLGAERSAYTAAVMRKSLSAAVGRATVGGIKYDYMPIIIGRQGLGKSTFLTILGKKWFSDSLTTFEGKEAAELIQGQWIVEVGELSAFGKQETNVIKQFLSKREDVYRAAYGRRTERHPRRCVFFGSTNNYEILRDITGNRRFWPVDCGVQEKTKDVWTQLPEEVDQIWAEAKELWKMQEPLYMTGELDNAAKNAQEEHTETSEKEGMIKEFLEKPIPENWEMLTLGQKRQFLHGNLQNPDGVALVKRQRICAAEIWVECFEGNINYMKPGDSREISGVLSQLPGWKKMKNIYRFGTYGPRRGYERE